MYHMPGDKYHIAGVQVRGSSTRTKKVRTGFLNNLGIKIKFEKLQGMEEVHVGSHSVLL